MKILVADDDAINRRIVCASLEKWSYETIIAKDGNEAWQLLQKSDAPQLAILDWMMPGMDGVDICRQLRESGTAKYTYVILLTAKLQKEEILQGLEAGADDYVTKPFDPAELRARLRAGERILGLQAELLEAQHRLECEATHDHLTGLWNRGAVMKLLRAELSRSQREPAPVGLIAVDLDHFKRINDTYGHPAGDAVLQEVAHRMHASVRLYDAAGRIGGEEFLVVLPRTDLACAAGQAERLRWAIAAAPVETGLGKLCITASFGVTAAAVSGTSGSAEADGLLQDADRALYHSKRTGRNRVTLFSDPAAASAQAPLFAGTEQPLSLVSDSDAASYLPG